MNYVVSEGDAIALNAALEAEVGHPCSFAHSKHGEWIYIPEHLAKAKIQGVPIDLDAVVTAADIGFLTLGDYVASLAEQVDPMTAVRDEVADAQNNAELKTAVLGLIDLLTALKVTEK